MRLKFFFTFAALCFCSLLFIQIINAQQPSSELLESIPQIEEKLNSPDIKQRISVLDALVVYKRDDDVTKTILPYNLSAADYAFVIKKIFEKDLAEIETKTVSQTLSKIEFLMKRFKLGEFAKNLVEYIPKFMPNGLDFSRIGIQYGILETLKQLKAVEFAPQIATLLLPSVRSLYREALSTLVELRVKEAVPALLSLLYDKDHMQRFYALESLVKVDGRETAPHIAKLLKDEHLNNRCWALNTLVKLDAHKNYVPEIRQMLSESTSLEAKTYAVAALVSANDKTAISLAVEMATDRDLTPRNEIMRRLAELKAEAVISPFIEVLKDKTILGGDIGTNSNIRASIIRGLQNLQAKAAIPVLRDYLRGQNLFLQTAAAQSLGVLNAVESIDDLLPLVNENATGNRGYAAAQTAIALAQIGERRTWKHLIDFASSPNCYYGSEIISTLNRHLDYKLWQKTQTIKVKGIDYKSIKTNVEAFKAEANIPLILEFQPETDKSKRKPLDESGYPWMRAGNEMSLDAALQEIVRTIDDGTHPQTFTFIFDNGTIRILPFEKAIAWWRKNILTK